MSDNMSASIDEDTMLVNLSESIDVALMEWLNEHKIPALNLTAVILARLTWLAKQGNYQEDFIRLLESPQEILKSEEKRTVVH
jgi:hypothetical protein